MIFNLAKVALSPALVKFKRELRRPRDAQQRLLAELLRDLSRTEYGRALKITGREDYADFAALAPIVNYDGLSAWLARQRETEGRVITAEPVLFYERTSGSSGAAKLIPYTAGLRRSFHRMFLIWLADLFRHGPPLKTGKTFISISPALHRSAKTARGIRIGLDDDTEYLRGLSRAMLKRFLVAPPAIRELEDPHEFKHTLAALLLAEPQLEVISVWNPSFFQLILDHIEQRRAPLAQALHSGEINGFRFRPVARERLKLFEESSIRWERVWPELKLISCWTDAHAAESAARLAAHFPHALIQGKGLLATEAPMTLPLIEAQGCVPLPAEVFYEFIDERGRVLRLNEIEAGCEYEIIITQRGGLVRYRIGDRVRVMHFYEAAPCLAFVGRSDAVCDLVGEKLTENFVAATLRQFADFAQGFQILLPVKQPHARSYYLLVTERLTIAPEDYSARVDEALCRSFHYGYARRLGQLDGVRVLVVPRAGEQYFAFYAGKGMKWGDIKESCLMKNTDDAAQFAARVLNATPHTPQA